ncbi:hypothetical protein GcC1_203039 [Golovinomyces cichoracearum]|uniref:Uncharacterized protein n=1 Tax=Golovinomyces cichoracearum TaxID=62708 RepID=A0A420HDE1_9PEZI|nr:hypothetical protein GcC1_203039 [Golovinomyces cichoracearum]
MFSAPNDTIADSRRRAYSYGLGPSLRFSEDAQEVIVGRLPVKKSKFSVNSIPNTEDLTPKKLSGIPGFASHLPCRSPITIPESRFYFHQRCATKASKKTRIDLRGRVSSFNSFRRRVLHLSFLKPLSNHSAIGNRDFSAAEKSYSLSPEKPYGNSSKGSSHASSLHNRSRGNCVSLKSVSTRAGKISCNKSINPSAEDQKPHVPNFSRRDRTSASVPIRSVKINHPDIPPKIPSLQLQKSRSKVVNYLPRPDFDSRTVNLLELNTNINGGNFNIKSFGRSRYVFTSGAGLVPNVIKSEFLNT